jgi:hypothetical protein
LSGQDRFEQLIVHARLGDAQAYARWAGKELPTEAEWEFAARGGLEFAWGDEFVPRGKHMANTWQGEFPRQNLADDGYQRTSPVTSFPPNGYGLFDMIGNVWEWTTDWYASKHEADALKACCVPSNPRGGREETSYDPCLPNTEIPRKVLKGGSYLLHQTTVAAIVLPPATRIRPTPRRATLGFAALSESLLSAEPHHTRPSHSTGNLRIPARIETRLRVIKRSAMNALKASVALQTPGEQWLTSASMS